MRGTLPAGAYCWNVPAYRNFDGYARRRFDPPLLVATAWGIFQMTTFELHGIGWRDGNKPSMITHAEAAIQKYDQASGITLRGRLRFTRTE